MKKVFLLFLVSFLMIFTKSSFAKEIVGPGGTSSGYKPDDVAFNVSIVTLTDGLNSSFDTDGHSFILIENITSLSFNVIGITIHNRETISLGTYGNTNPTGLWINRELQVIGGKIAHNSVYLTKQVKIKDEDKLDKFLLEQIDWNYTRNCSTYAVNFWNKMFNDSLSAKQGLIDTPTGLYNSIMSKNYFQKDIYLPLTTYSRPH